MKNLRKHIDDFFREKLGKYTETPPEDVWDGLDKRLDTLVPANTTTFRWGRHLLIVSLIATLSIPFVRSLTNKTHTDIAANISTEKSNSAVTDNNTAPVNSAATPAPSAQPTQQQTGTESAQAKTNDENKDWDAWVNANTGSGIKGNAYSVYAENARAGKANKRAAAANRRLRRQHVVMGTDNDANVYHSGNAVSAQEAEAFENTPSSGTPATTNAVAAQPQPAAFKKETKNETAKPQIQKPADEHVLSSGTRHFELGIKGGFEGGFSTDAASKIFAAPYVEYNVSSKLAIMIQPAVKLASVTSRTIDNQSFYSANNDGSMSSATTDVRSSDGGIMHDNYTTHYTFTQSHDSIVKSSVYGGNYVELELPILLKYNVSKKLSVYGGPNIVYSKAPAVAEKTYTKQGIIATRDSTIYSVDALPNTPDLPINYPGKPISSYAGPLNPNQGAQLRLGYMLGFSYEYSHRWLFDAAVQQSRVKPNVQGDYNVNLPLSSPYFRLSVGYKLTHL